MYFICFRHTVLRQNYITLQLSKARLHRLLLFVFFNILQSTSHHIIYLLTDLGERAYMYYVYVDHTRVTEGTKDIICAMQDIMCTYYVHNYKYLKATSKLLELIQQYFLKITPSNASKSNAYRVGNQQRVVRRVIDALAKHDCDASGSK